MAPNWCRDSRAAPCWPRARLFCLPATAMAQATDGTAVDTHSHAGNLIRASYSGRISLLDVASPMRQGGLSVVCLCIVGDSPIISSKSGRIRPVREPHPGELYDFSKVQFAKLHELARDAVDADREDGRRPARGAVEPAVGDRDLGRRGLARRQDRAPRRGVPALAAAPAAAHALSAQRAGRHPDRAHRCMAA